jgi:hypothetical protein
VPFPTNGHVCLAGGDTNGIVRNTANKHPYNCSANKQLLDEIKKKLEIETILDKLLYKLICE